MFRTRFLSLFTALLCLAGAPSAAAAGEVACDSVYCFTQEDFSQEALAGICITQLPEAEVGTVMLGTRVLRPGDILASDQIAQMTFAPVRTQEDCSATVSYLPIFDDHVAPSATMTIAIRGKEDKAPVAEDFAAETYKNLPIDGKLKVKDPEGQVMTYTVTRGPKRGSVVIHEDGSFTYTPKKNKVGIDSFVYTASDPAGNVSRESTVTITIVKPTDAPQYTDTIGKSCRFAAEWMKNTGIFVGETLDGNACFSPDKEVTRGEFLTMLMKSLDIPMEDTQTLYTDEIPTWLQPYVAAAVRSGITAGLPNQEVFGADIPITEAEAAVMLQNALSLTVQEETVMAEETVIPEWAVSSVRALGSNGIDLSATANLTRSHAAQVLYQAFQMAEDAPGMDIFR